MRDKKDKPHRVCGDIRDICGDYALDINYFSGYSFTLYFNSRRNAETVKRCLDLDASIPNAATAVDFVEVVRCKNCKWYDVHGFYCLLPHHTHKSSVNDFCSYGERRS